MLGGKNKQTRQPLGYTIVEVMIVLAVSGIMFLIAAQFINGKQEKAAFTQGSNDMASKLQQVVQDVTDGHYSDVPLTCTVSGSGVGATISVTTTSSGEQGTASDCVFLGKIVSFYDTSGGTNRNNYSIFSIAAARNITSIPNNLIAAVGGSPSLTTQSVTPQNLYVKKMTIVDASSGSPSVNPSNTYNIGFLQGLGNVDKNTGSYLTGAQQPVQLVYADTTHNKMGDESYIAGTTIRLAKNATICVSDGARNADIFIGGSTSPQQASSNNNNELNISVQQLGTAPC